MNLFKTPHGGKSDCINSTNTKVNELHNDFEVLNQCVDN